MTTRWCRAQPLLEEILQLHLHQSLAAMSWKTRRFSTRYRSTKSCMRVFLAVLQEPGGRRETDPSVVSLLPLLKQQLNEFDGRFSIRAAPSRSCAARRSCAGRPETPCA